MARKPARPKVPKLKVTRAKHYKSPKIKLKKRTIKFPIHKISSMSKILRKYGL